MPKILIVEDKISVRLTIQAVLEDAGYDVGCASDGQEAIHKLQQASRSDSEHYDLLISDIMMPKVNGIELATGLRASNNQIPVLLISGGGYNMVADSILDSVEELADGVLKKPFTNEELIVEVNRLLQKKT